jgi:N,N'-diacetyllegionaminate synthase
MVKTYIIAEAGVNHNGDIENAKKLVHLAKESGANCIKFQTFNAESIASSQTPLADYQKISSLGYKNQLDLLKSLELSYKSHKDLFELCQKVKIDFLSTPFDIKSLQLLTSLGCNRIKISSGDLTNYFLLNKVSEQNLSVILSTGMGDLQEVSDAIECLSSNALTKKDISLLHCTSGYPCPTDSVNLKAMNTLAQNFHFPIGYSDHTIGCEVAIAAVAAGAKIIEKHFTLDTAMPGPDHRSSLNPKEFKKLVQGIRRMEVIMGSEVKQTSAVERQNKLLVRKSLVAQVKILKGEKFTYQTLTAKRPGNGLSPMLLPSLIGKKAKKTFNEGDQVEL